jgi:hypothetical protein
LCYKQFFKNDVSYEIEKVIEMATICKMQTHKRKFELATNNMEDAN